MDEGESLSAYERRRPSVNDAPVFNVSALHAEGRTCTFCSCFQRDSDCRRRVQPLVLHVAFINTLIAAHSVRICLHHNQRSKTLAAAAAAVFIRSSAAAPIA
jgi:hypothetical protein